MDCESPRAFLEEAGSLQFRECPLGQLVRACPGSCLIEGEGEGADFLMLLKTLGFTSKKTDTLEGKGAGSR